MKHLQSVTEINGADVMALYLKNHDVVGQAYIDDFEIEKGVFFYGTMYEVGDEDESNYWLEDFYLLNEDGDTIPLNLVDNSYNRIF